MPSKRGWECLLMALQAPHHLVCGSAPLGAKQVQALLVSRPLRFLPQGGSYGPLVRPG